MMAIAPLSYAESWDRVGLLVGRKDAPLHGPVTLTIDLTEAVLDEALRSKSSAVIAYHPTLWDPLTRLTADSPGERVILRAAESRVAIYSPHTALDAATGGINDWLCEGLSGGTGKILGDCRSLRPLSQQAATHQLKIVTFVPLSEVDRLRGALATAGAGNIGEYTLCSFASEGTGTFLGSDASHPRRGDRGTFERVPEMRLEMVVSRKALSLALETLRQFHPYEEPAVDVYELLPQPARGIGAGRRLMLDHDVSIAELAGRMKKHLGVQSVMAAMPAGGDVTTRVSRIGVCAGAGAALVGAAIEDGCQLFMTGELKHHEVMAALKSGIGVMVAGHTNTERGYLPRLASRLQAAVPGLTCLVAQSDRDPLMHL